jgi:hypothetical protein
LSDSKTAQTILTSFVCKHFYQMNSHLSPLPQYILPPPTRSRSLADIRRAAAIEELAVAAADPQWQTPYPYRQPRLLHPLYSEPRRHWHLANGRQPIVTVSAAYVPPKTRRTDPFLRTYTLRHSNTQQLTCARPSTVNRFSHLNQNNYWDDRLSFLLEDIGRISRSMTNWNSIKPERRFMLRTLVPTHLCRSVTEASVPIR